MAVSILVVSDLSAQGGLLKKVAKSMTNELLGKSGENSNNAPEPSCACDKPELIMDLGGKLQLDYTEITLKVSEDGRILARHTGTNEYYIVKNGTTQGPYKEGDPRIADFVIIENEEDKGIESFILKNRPYINKAGDKLSITFDGKTYGPFSQINDFTVSKSKDKFAALVIENVIVSEDYGKKMDDAMNNAKNDQERMDLAIQFSQQMQQKLLEGGDPMNTVPKLVTNIPDANYDFYKSQGEKLNSNIKYDDILFTTFDKIISLDGKTLISLSNDAIGTNELFVNEANTKYAYYKYGSLKFSDNTSMSDLFNPHLIKENGQVFLAYMYYSPKKNSIMQCKIAF